MDYCQLDVEGVREVSVVGGRMGREGVGVEFLGWGGWCLFEAGRSRGFLDNTRDEDDDEIEKVSVERSRTSYRIWLSVYISPVVWLGHTRLEATGSGFDSRS